MDLQELKKAAEKRVVLEYDAWAEWTDVEREAVVYRTMLQILEESDESNFVSRLLVARAIWENKIWSAVDDSFAGYICELGGRYQNEDGQPSGVAYDLANFVSIAWDVLVQLGENPVKIATTAWSKTRLTIATIRSNTRLIGDGGRETTNINQARRVEMTDPGAIRAVVKMAKDPDMTVRDMASKTYTPRLEKFGGSMSLRKDGLWDVSLNGLSEKQMAIVQRVLDGYAELRLM